MAPCESDAKLPTADIIAAIADWRQSVASTEVTRQLRSASKVAVKAEPAHEVIPSYVPAPTLHLEEDLEAKIYKKLKEIKEQQLKNERLTNHHTNKHKRIHKHKYHARSQQQKRPKKAVIHSASSTSQTTATMAATSMTAIPITTTPMTSSIPMAVFATSTIPMQQPLVQLQSPYSSGFPFMIQVAPSQLLAAPASQLPVFPRNPAFYFQLPSQTNTPQPQYTFF